MYDPDAVLQRISDSPVPVLLFGGVAILANLVYYVEMYRASSRAGVMPLTVLAIATFIPHDGAYVLSFDKWFNEYDHWFPILFWVALIVTCCFAFAFLRLIVIHGRADTGARVSQRVWTAGVAAAVAAGCVVWAILKANLDDDLYFLSFMITITWCALSGTALLVRRGSARGQSVRQWQAFTVMGAGFFCCSQWFGPPFQTVEWYLLSAVSVGWGAALVLAVSRLHAQGAREDVLEDLADPAVQPQEAGVGVRG